MTEIIATASQKGGTGKTTTSVNVSASLASKKKRVLLIDMDLQANATTACGITPIRTLTTYQVLLGEASLSQAIVASGHGFDILPATKDLAAFELDVVRTQELSEYHILKNILKQVTDKYDYIVLDLPADLDVITINGLNAATDVLIPVEPSRYSVDGAVGLVDTISYIKRPECNPALSVKPFMTRYRRGYVSHRLALRMAEHFFKENGTPMLKQKIKECIRFQEAPWIGKPAVLVASERAVQDYHLLVKEAFGV